MYVSITGNKDNQDVYIKQSYRKDNGKTSSRIYKKLGKYNDLLAQFSGDETAMMAWAKKEAEKERGKSGGRERTRKYEGYSSCQKEKKGKAAKRYYICFKKEFHHEDFSMGILVYVSMCICKRRISNHKTPSGR